MAACHILGHDDDVRIERSVAADERKDGDDDGTGLGVATRTRTRTKKPSPYKVLMLNDDYTPMEFVVLVLQRFFKMGIEDATRVMLARPPARSRRLRRVQLRGRRDQGQPGDRLRPARTSTRSSARWRRPELPHRLACGVRPPSAARSRGRWTASSSAAASASRARSRISGAKNAALTLLPCALLTDEPLTLRNLPRLADVDSFGHLLNQLGVSTTRRGRQGRRIRPGDDACAPRASPRPSRPTTSSARCAPRSSCSGRCSPAPARRRCRCPAAARSATGRSTSI